MLSFCQNFKIFQQFRQFSFKLIDSVGTRKVSTSSTISANNDSKLYNDFLNTNRRIASRSIVVQVSSDKSFSELYDYCRKFGKIIQAYHYKIPSEDLHYILVEYNDEDNLNETLNYGCYNNDISGVPVHSQFLWFKANGRRKFKTPSIEAQKKLKTVNGLFSPTDLNIFDTLNAAENLEDQIKILYNSTKLSDLEIRLRFLAAKQIEKSISGIFPYANVIPFGSSVNGFGKSKCDLDLILKFDKDFIRQENNSTNSRLVFHAKENLTNGRFQVQRQMECIGDMLHLFLPGVSNVRRILQARVPIIKFFHEYLNLEIDLSMSVTGAYMSELLFIFGELDHRVRPLTFCLRKWAQNSGLTNSSPGRWITNFSLTCLVIFFLQQLKNPILPPIDFLVKSACPEDTLVTKDGINCTFLHNFTLLKFVSNNESTISELLLQFFEFYSVFDFQNRAISLNEGRSIMKPDHCAIYIVNPLEQTLNVCKNISFEECERLRIEIRNAAWTLESEMDTNKPKIGHNEEEKLANWGLINLLKQQQIIRPNLFFRSRMVEVKELFKENDDDIANNLEKSIKRNKIKNSKNRAENRTEKVNVQEIQYER